MKRVLAVSSLVFFLATACTSGSDEVATTSSSTQAPTTTVTTEASTTTTEAETTTTIDPLGEEAVEATMDTYFSFVWDEPNLGIGHISDERLQVLAPPVSDRFAASLAERQADNHFAQGHVTGDIISVDVTGTEATVIACTTDALGTYDAAGAVVIAPDDFNLRTRYVLQFDELAGWRISQFFLGEECER